MSAPQTVRRHPSPAPQPIDYTLIFDGGSEGNPGPGYGSWVLINNLEGTRHIQRRDFEQTMTNNEAEYAALCDGLEYLVGLIRSFGRDPAEFSLEVRGDSELILRQLSGRYRARDRRMAAARNRALALLQSFKSFVLTHQPREETVRQLGH